MSLQNFTANIQNNMTFKKLEDIINIWTEWLVEQQRNFILQFNESNKLTLNVTDTSDKTQVEQLIQYGNYVNAKIEEILKQLEKDVLVETQNVPLDLYRHNTYNTAYNFNLRLSNYQQALDEIKGHSAMTNEEILINPTETIAQLLQSQLQHLEDIEMKSTEISSKLNEVEYYKQRALRYLKLKENKLY